MKNVTGIIVAYNSEDLIFDSVTAALDAGISSLFVWDNSQTNNSSLALKDISDNRLTVLSDGENHGFGGGINRVLDTGVATELVLLINPDCFLSRDVLGGLSDLFIDEKTGVAAPRMTYDDGQSGIAGGPFPNLVKEFLAKLRIDEYIPKYVRRRLLSLFRSRVNGTSLADSLKSGSPIEMDWVSGFCMMVRSDLLQMLSGFDEDYFLYFEDVDICRRARAAGYSVKLARNVSALHLESTSTGAVGKSAHYYRGLSVYLSKHGTRSQRFVAKLVGLIK